MAIDPVISKVLADAVLLLHVGIACFIVLGLVATVVGNLGGWRWVNDFWFRLAHLLAIGIVVAESWLGFVCPLTTLETWLRVQADGFSYVGGFIEHWLHAFLFFSAPPWVFAVGYSLFGIAVLASWWFFPPRRAIRAHHERSAQPVNPPGST